MVTDLDRREFLITTAIIGGGMALSLHIPETQGAESAGARLNARPWLPPSEGGVEVNPWIVIGPDDRVLIRVNQSELGQGVMTSNPMMICEELECDWSKVQSVYAEPNRHVREHDLYDHLHTEASSSVRLGRALYQQAGASARERRPRSHRVGRRGRTALRELAIAIEVGEHFEPKKERHDGVGNVVRR